MPESEAAAGLGQHADGACLVYGRDQVSNTAVQHDRQVRDREVHAEQGRCLQDLAYRPGDKAKAVRDGRGQGARRGAAGQLGGSRLGDGQTGAAGQRGDQFGEVERVARCPVGEPQQVAVRLPAGQGGHQVGRGRLGERGELEAGVVAYHSPQRQQVIPLGYWAHHPDQQQRCLPGQLRKLAAQGDGGRVGPLQVVNDQDGRPHRALLGDQRQQLLRQCCRHVSAAVRGGLTAQ